MIVGIPIRKYLKNLTTKLKLLGDTTHLQENTETRRKYQQSSISRAKYNYKENHNMILRKGQNGGHKNDL